MSWKAVNCEPVVTSPLDCVSAPGAANSGRKLDGKVPPELK